MLKKDVIEYFGGCGNGGVVATAKALGINRAAVSQFGDVIPVNQALILDKITGGKLRFDKKLYQAEALKNYKGDAKI